MTTFQDVFNIGLIQEAICSYLDFDQVLILWYLLRQPSITSPIPVHDPDRKILFLPGMNAETVAIYNIFRKKGSISAMIMAIRNGDLETIQKLLALGVDINSQENKGNTLLMKAIQEKNWKLTQYFLTKGADPNLKNRRGHSAITLVDTSRSNIIKLLLDHGADLNTTLPGSNHHIIFKAAGEDGWETVQLLLNRDANFDSTIRYQGENLIHYAAAANRTNIVVSLIKKGCDPNIRCSDNYTALMHAIENEAAQTVRILLKNGADPHLMGYARVSPLGLAKQTKNKDIIKLIETALG